jgi:hypothetical protein
MAPIGGPPANNAEINFAVSACSAVKCVIELLTADPGSPVDAVVLLDTTQDYWTLADRRFAYFSDPVLDRRRELAAPLLFAARPPAMFELGDSLSAARRWYVWVERLVATDTVYRTVFRDMTRYARYYDQVGELDQAASWWRMAAALNPADSVVARRTRRLEER